MQTHNQADLFVLEFEQVTADGDELTLDQVVLRVRNLALDQATLNLVLAKVFAEGEMVVYPQYVKITLARGADYLLDGKHDWTDTEDFLAELAEEILAGLKSTPGWGESDKVNRRFYYDLID